jgi:hypothetical protein
MPVTQPWRRLSTGRPSRLITDRNFPPERAFARSAPAQPGAFEQCHKPTVSPLGFPGISAKIIPGAPMGEGPLSRRDRLIVARHEVPGEASSRKNRPVGYGVIPAGVRAGSMIGDENFEYENRLFSPQETRRTFRPEIPHGLAVPDHTVPSGTKLHDRMALRRRRHRTKIIRPSKRPHIIPAIMRYPWWDTMTLELLFNLKIEVALEWIGGRCVIALKGKATLG